MRHAETVEQRKHKKLGSISNELTVTGAGYCCQVAQFVYSAVEEMKLKGEKDNSGVLVLTGTAPVHLATSENLHKSRVADGDRGKKAAESVGRFPVMSTSLLNELDGGDCNGMTYEEMGVNFPDIIMERDRDKLNFRYPGAGGESYVDVIHRLGPIILELERQKNSVLVISHLAVQRCIFGYFDNTAMQDIPYLDMDQHTLYELKPGPFGTQVNKHKLA
jgi:broad specificity phosphatase PhoE